MDTGIAITIAGFFISAGSIILVSLGMRNTSIRDDYTALEKRIVLCEQDRQQLRGEVNSLRDSNLWLTQRLSEREQK